MLYYAYVIKSIHQKYYYKGHCHDLEKRLAEHNSGKTKSNKAYLPFEICYFEEFTNREEAIKREKYFKSASGRRYLQAKLVP
jgi:putative endonuclease